MRKKPAHQVVAEKRHWHYQQTPEEQAQGFKGWYSRGYLPHFDAPGTRQFIIENNPVKAGLVREPTHWRWSSAPYRRRYGSDELPKIPRVEERGPA